MFLSVQCCCCCQDFSAFHFSAGYVNGSELYWQEKGKYVASANTFIPGAQTISFCLISVERLQTTSILSMLLKIWHMVNKQCSHNTLKSAHQYILRSIRCRLTVKYLLCYLYRFLSSEFLCHSKLIHSLFLQNIVLYFISC
jgi:hypothetical protein